MCGGWPCASSVGAPDPAVALCPVRGRTGSQLALCTAGELAGSNAVRAVQCLSRCGRRRRRGPRPLPDPGLATSGAMASCFGASLLAQESKGPACPRSCSSHHLCLPVLALLPSPPAESEFFGIPLCVGVSGGPQCWPGTWLHALRDPVLAISLELTCGRQSCAVCCLC